MKTLTLLRHAKAAPSDPSRRDFDRPLSARGREAARAMGGEMARLGLRFDAVIASPSARTRETLAEIAEALGPIEPLYDERVYLAEVATLLDIVRTGDDAQESLLIVGHNPGMEGLVLLLARQCALRGEVAANYPTGALAEIAFDATSWREVDEGLGTLSRFIRPRDLEPG